MRKFCSSLPLLFKMDSRLEEASQAGDLAMLRCLLQEDRLLLHKLSAATPSVANNPVHIAALLGHADFVREVLRLNPDLARDTNVDGLTSLHLASARGHLPVVIELISTPAVSDLCRIRDSDGLLPVHTAAVKGRVRVLHALLEKSPELIEELLSSEETILHCAVKSGCYETVQMLVEKMTSDQVLMLLNSKDDNGNTVLHLAAARRQFQTIRMLLMKPEMKANELNVRGLTVFDVLLESPNHSGDMTLARMIMAAGGKTSSEVHHRQSLPSIPNLIESRTSLPSIPDLTKSHTSLPSIPELIESPTSLPSIPDLTESPTMLPSIPDLTEIPTSQLSIPDHTESHTSLLQTKFQICLRLMLRGMRWLALIPVSQCIISEEEMSKSSGTLMVVATLIATITFQPIMNPPGGFDSKTGYATRGKALRKFLMFDIIGLFSSLSIILLLMCVGQQMKRKLMEVLVCVLWIAAYSTALAFTFAAYIVFPHTPAVTALIIGWYVIFAITVLWVYLRFIILVFVKVGWLEINPSYGQTNFRELNKRRVLALIAVLAIPVLVMIPGPDFLIDMLFFCGISSDKDGYVLSKLDSILFHLWVVVSEVPTLYIWLRFTHSLLGIVGCCNGAESRIPRSSFDLVMKRVLIMSLIVAGTSVVGFQFYYVNVAMWSPNNFSNNILLIKCD